MFKNLSISNLRSINKLKINDFNKINIIVGPNNSGKTTILEALFLLIGMSNPPLNVTINNFRDLIFTDNNDLSFNFRNLDLKNYIELIAKDSSDGIRKLKITPIPTKNTTRINDQNVTNSVNLNNAITNINPETKSKTDIDGINLDFSKYLHEKKAKKYHSELFIEQGKINFKQEHDYKETLFGRFYNNKTLYSNLPDRIGELLQKKKKDELINLLKIIDRKVEDISLSNSGMVYIDIGLNEMVPINIMGDGFKKACAVIANLLILEKGVFLIDELENGLHFKTIELLWKSIFETTEKFNQQIFIATHSYESIRVLLEVIVKQNYNKDNIRVFSIQKDFDGNHHCYKYDFENLEASIRANVEIRGELV